MVSKIDNIKIPDMGPAYNEADAARAVSRFISELTLLSKTPPGTRGKTDIDELFPLIQNAVRTREEEDQVPEDKKLLVLEDDPPEAIDTEAITFVINARMPGRYDQGTSGAGGIKELVPHARAINNHPEHPSEKLVTMGKFYGTWIGLNVYARTGKQALKRLLWLERVMDSYAWYFRLFGYRVIEEEVGNRMKVMIGDNEDKLELVKYPMVYFVRSEDIFHVTSQELKKVLITTNVAVS